MTTVQAKIVGGTYAHRSLPLSAQRCINWWPEVELTGKEPVALVPFPGCKPWLSGVATEKDRGMHVMDTGQVFKVSGGFLYQVDSDVTQTNIGTIVGAGQVIMADDGTNLIIITGANAYHYDGASLLSITDIDYEQGDSVAYMNNQFIYDGIGGRFAVSDAGLPTTINGLNYATAESYGDDLSRVFVHNELLYLFGSTSIESWYNSGVGNPPFDRIQSSTLKVGLGALHSVCSNKEFTYFLGNDLNVYQMRSYQLKKVTPIAVQSEFSGFTTSDAKGFCFQMEAQEFYMITFPTSDRTFCFNEETGWFELAHSAAKNRHLTNSYVYAYNKHLVADYRNGNVYELDFDTFTDNSDVIIRERITHPITSDALGVKGIRIEMSRFQVIMETGTGTATGQGQTPQIMFSASYDGGKSYSDEDWVEAGRTGEGRLKIEWYNMASFYECVIKIKVSDPVKWVIHSAAIDLQPAGY